MIKSAVLFILALICGITISCSSDNGNEDPPITGERYKVPLGDPFILYYNNMYYAYGTQSDDGIVVYTSSDLKTWEKQPKLALSKDDSYADRWFWAPEIYYIKEKNKFFMYYSADEHICVAVSDSPLGPFKQDEKKPMYEGFGIDNSLFIDDDGKAYISFVRSVDGTGTLGNSIWVAELENDLKKLEEALKSMSKKDMMYSFYSQHIEMNKRQLLQLNAKEITNGKYRYEGQDTSRVIATIVNCRMTSLVNPVLKAKQTKEGSFLLSPDEVVCFGQLK